MSHCDVQPIIIFLIKLPGCVNDISVKNVGNSFYFLCKMHHLTYFFFFLLDLQNVNITLRILFRPLASELPKIYMSLGEDFDERVLPSITTEVLKAVVVSITLNQNRMLSSNILYIKNMEHMFRHNMMQVN